VLKWLREHEEFAAQYARARELLLEHWEEEQLEIADDGSNDWMKREAENGRVTIIHDFEHWRRSQLRIETRKWLMSKLLPRKYGDRVDLRHGNPDGTPLVFQVMNYAHDSAPLPVQTPSLPAPRTNGSGSRS
jgi:hypothetical protein